MAAKVLNCTSYNDNPYHELLFGSIRDRYVPRKGVPADAITQKAAILHVHWEEHCLRKARTAVEAKHLSADFLQGLSAAKSKGIKIVWTIHNITPHELEYVEVFLELRKKLADIAERILVHNLQSISELRKQGVNCLEKFFLLPHPSYIGIYPELEANLATISDKTSSDRTYRNSPSSANTGFLAFGMVRRYKNLEFLLDVLNESPQILETTSLRVMGSVFKDDPYGDELQSKYGHLAGLTLSFERVPDEALGDMFASASCLILPYKRFLTSGAALLGITAGVPIVAPDCAQMRELLPPQNHEYLFQPGNADSLKTCLVKLRDLSQEETGTLKNACRKRAEQYHPSKISTKLGQLYDSLRGVTQKHKIEQPSIASSTSS